MRLSYYCFLNTNRFISRYVRQHYKNKLNQTPNYEYLGHPINAYHFIRHVVREWEHVLQFLPALLGKNSTSIELGTLMAILILKYE